MKCPFCHHDIIPKSTDHDLGKDSVGQWKLIAHICPNDKCGRLFLQLATINVEWHGPPNHRYPVEKTIDVSTIYPKVASREKAPSEVPIGIAKDFNEAVLILNDSPKASAALSRRCLQNVLREKAKVKPGNLSDEIQEILDRNELPGHLADSLDYIRQIGNFAAHPIKSQKTGEIIDVESGEAEWTLDLLEGLFDFYFVQPEKTRKKKEALDKKIASIKKLQEK